MTRRPIRMLVHSLALLALSAPVLAAPAPSSDGIVGLGACSTGAPAAARGGGAPGGAAGAGRAGAGAAAPARTPAPVIRTTPQNCLEIRDQSGFTDIFDGRDLNGWDGAPGRWSVVGGVLTGETTADNPLRANTFLIWRGGTVKNFDMQFEWRLSAGGNGGIQYRSQEFPDLGDHVVRGLQFDMGDNAAERYTGNIFEEGGTSFLATRGSLSWDTGTRRDTIGRIGGNAITAGYIKSGDWNRGEIIARDGLIIHLINDQVVAVTMDDNLNRVQQGVVALQLHTGAPMKLEFKSIRLKTL